MSIKLKGQFYYTLNTIPVNVVRVATTKPGESAHPHDATEVEHYHDFSESEQSDRLIDCKARISELSFIVLFNQDTLVSDPLTSRPASATNSR